MPSLLWDSRRSAFVALAEALLQGCVRTLKLPWSRQGVSDRAPLWNICAPTALRCCLTSEPPLGSPQSAKCRATQGNRTLDLPITNAAPTLEDQQLQGDEDAECGKARQETQPRRNQTPPDDSSGEE